MEKNYCSYNLEYEGVLCTAVNWEDYIFVFQFHGKEYQYQQQGNISCSADTGHIRCVILEFKQQLMQKFFDEHYNEC